MAVWFVEGLPGTGKSTMAKNLCSMASKSGYDAKWYLEESHDHPVHPKKWRALKSDDHFINQCLQAWARFTEECLKQDTVHILEGSAFQSTVRFMMEKNRPGIQQYYRRFEEIVAPLYPRMVYLRPRDALQHSEYASALRGEHWTAKVSGYIERTPYATSSGLKGVGSMHRFWADYAALCDELVVHATIPAKTVSFEPGDWARHMAEATEFLGLTTAPGH
jgi:hypothetical protein